MMTTTTTTRMMMAGLVLAPEGDLTMGGSGGGGGGSPAPASSGGWQAQALGQDGGFVPGWQEKQPESMAEYRSMLGQFKDFGGLAKALKDNMALARSKTEGMVRVPGAQATAEEVAAFHKALGVPEEAAGYELGPPEQMPGGVAWDEPMSQAFAAKARELGLTKTQARALADFHVQQTGTQVEGMRANAAEFLELERQHLQERFGGNMDRVVAEAMGLEGRRGVPPAVAAAVRSGAFNPTSDNFWGVDALEFASWAARASGEDRGTGSSGVGSGAVNLAAAKDIMTNKANPLHARYWAGDAEAVERVSAAYRGGA